MRRAGLATIEWPDFGLPDLPPALALDEVQGRIAALRRAMESRGLDILVIYGDREHAANIHWATGFDPRFEEALLILGPDEPPTLAVGNECLPYAGLAPMAAAGRMRVVLCPSLSLISQPRDRGERIDRLLRSVVPAQARIGTVGWKYWTDGEADDPAGAIEIPAFVVDVLREIGAGVTNATDLLMHPGHGLRARVSPDEVARLEFANALAAGGIRRMIAALREGMTDFEAVRAAGIDGLPLGCHITFATGDRADQGLSGPTGQRLRLGSPLSFNVCHWGANICRAGWVARQADDLPVAAHAYMGEFVGPYVAAMSEWMSLMRPGVTGGQVWDRMMALLPPDLFGVTLNPGHLIGLDEWISSPVFAGSDLPLLSGMAMQSDVIPGHPVFASTRMEDGYAIADADFRADLAERHPAMAARCAARRAFMRDLLGLDVPESLLPLADTCGIVAPFLLSPDQVVVLR